MPFTKIPPLAPYVGAWTGDERFEIATSGDVNTALSRNVAARDLLKVIGALADIAPVPAGNFRVGLFRVSDGAVFSRSIDQLGIPVGNVPPGGLTGQILVKLSNADFDDSWANLVFTGEVTGSGVLPLALTITANAVTTVKILNNAVTNAKLAQAAALSVKGNPTNALADVQDVVGVANQVLRVNSAGTSWAFGAINLAAAAAVTGTLGPTNGGTGQATYVLGDILYSDAANSLAKLAGNIIATRKFLRQTGSGAVSAAPVWDTILAADIPGSALTKADDTNVTLTLGGTPATALLAAVSITAGWTGTLAASRLNANVVQSVVNDTNVTGSIAAQALTLGWTGTLAVARGGIGVGTLTNHGILLGQAASAVVATAVMTDGQLLVGQTGADPLPKTASGDVTVAASGAHTVANNAITYAKMQDISATARFLGRITAGAGDTEELTGTQATTLLDVFTSGLKGLVPASGGGTTTFLRADGTFATAGGFTAASQADQEAASSNTVGVTPGVQQFHPSAAKAWGTVSYAGGVNAPVLQDVFNVTSVTDGGTTDTQFNFTVSFSNATYAVVNAVDSSSAGSNSNGLRSAGNIIINHATEVTGSRITIAAFGDQ